jgi:DNA-binding NarL/FixJ family response regulator
MPGTNGLHFTRKLTAMNHSAPIIMVTMWAEDIREAALKAGAVADFAKRVSPDVLLDTIRVALEGKQSPHRDHLPPSVDTQNRGQGAE